MPPAIRVENLSKRYRIRHGSAATYRTLRDEIMHAAGVPLRWIKGQQAASIEDFWALKNVSFDVQPGEVAGVIGRNGAGKSTLLKILSRITVPTSGRVEMRGRVGSLLEVGTGFHPELTGRENIFLSGAILGMPRAEIARKFDEIVAFAEIEQFLDTPVKRYSSGMYVRLAFSVAAHLEPDVLVIDEVLAVGDAQFQRKCMERMAEIGRSGVAVLFVSHNMQQVQRLCSMAVVLKSGEVEVVSDQRTACRTYFSSTSLGPAERHWEDDPNSVVVLRSAGIRDCNGELSNVVQIDKPFNIRIEYSSRDTRLRTNAAIQVFNDQGILLFASADFSNREPQNGLVRVECQIPANLLSEGVHSVLVAVVRYNPEFVYSSYDHALRFDVVDSTTGDGSRGDYRGTNWPGIMRPKLNWQSADATRSASSV
jgi:lipopolysaccharide transport system ATP-binding protein